MSGPISYVWVAMEVRSSSEDGVGEGVVVVVGGGGGGGTHNYILLHKD